jgi:integrase
VIQKRERRRRDGTRYVVWRVRWHDATGAERNRTFDTKADAETFEAKVRVAKRPGDLVSIDAGRQLLADFAEEWWELYAKPNLQAATLANYAAVWNKHALPRLGSVRLRDLSPAVIADFRRQLDAHGVGAPTARKTLVMLQSTLRCAVEWQRIAANPVQAVRKPSAKRTRAVRPLPPHDVERLRAWLLEHRDQRDATLTCVLAYAGVRPQEALGLRWGSIGERTLLVEEAVSYGALKGQKNERPPRTVRLLAPLRADLADLWIAVGRPGDDELVFPAASGSPWPLHDWQNWRRRTFGAVVRALDLTGVVPYDLRHSFASLLIHEGAASVVEIAGYLGHSPTMTLNNTRTSSRS